MADLTPKTRSESFLNGEDLEPITRREHFYAGRENELPEGHQEPETREEWFIQKYREAGDVTVESLSITENGTYTAPSGKAYSPVSVNVPLPDNAYLLKSIENVNIATFTDGTDNFVKSLEVAIEPVQSGSGDPSPENIRPISGWTACNVTRSGKNLAYSQTNNTVVAHAKKGVTYTLSFDGTNRGANIKKNTSTGDKVATGANPLTFTADEDFDIFLNAWNSEFTNLQVEVGSSATTYETYNGTTITIDLDGTRYGGKLDVVNGIVTPAPYYASYNGEALTGEWISDRDKYEVGATPTIGAQVVNIGASDTPVSLTPTIVKSLQGDNNLFASTGEIEMLQYWGEVS